MIKLKIKLEFRQKYIFSAKPTRNKTTEPLNPNKSCTNLIIMYIKKIKNKNHNIVNTEHSSLSKIIWSLKFICVDSFIWKLSSNFIFKFATPYHNRIQMKDFIPKFYHIYYEFPLSKLHSMSVIQ